MERVDWTQATWRRSSKCRFADTGCVEVAKSNGMVCLRDSKDPAGPILHFTMSEWQDFVAGLKQGDFD